MQLWALLPASVLPILSENILSKSLWRVLLKPPKNPRPHTKKLGIPSELRLGLVRALKFFLKDVSLKACLAFLFIHKFLGFSFFSIRGKVDHSF